MLFCSLSTLLSWLPEFTDRYLYYKLLVEDDLRYYRGLGIGGSLVPWNKGETLDSQQRLTSFVLFLAEPGLR